jgi:hypothetical protein
LVLRKLTVRRVLYIVYRVLLPEAVENIAPRLDVSVRGVDAEMDGMLRLIGPERYRARSGICEV